MDFNQPQQESSFKPLFLIIVGIVVVLAIIAGIRYFTSRNTEVIPSAPVALEENSIGQVAGTSTPEYTGPKTVVVTLTDQGFTPANIIIYTDDTINFVNESNSRMWVASDPHPTHTEYPGFDAKKAIESGGNFEFMFSKPGVWKFHNHLNPVMRGTVTVVAVDLKG